MKMMIFSAASRILHKRAEEDDHDHGHAAETASTEAVSSV